jgi:hypothetical protein
MYRIIPSIINIIIYLNCKWVLPGGSGTTIRHNTQITHITQITHHTQTNTAHKTTQTIKETLHTMNTMQMHLQLQLMQLFLSLLPFTTCFVPKRPSLGASAMPKLFHCVKCPLFHITITAIFPDLRYWIL